MTTDYILIDPADEHLEELYDPKSGEARYRVKLGTIGCNAMCLLGVDIDTGDYTLDYPHPSCLYHGQGWEWNDGMEDWKRRDIEDWQGISLRLAYASGILPTEPILMGDIDA